MIRAALAVILGLALSAPGLAQQRAGQRPAAPPVEKPAAPVEKPAPAAPEPAPPVYEPQLLHLAEILGALTFLSDLCRAELPAAEARAGEVWRTRMRDLLEAEAATAGQKERFAGAFNRGLVGYRTTYRVCTPSGRLAIERLRADGARLAHDLASRYGS